MSPCHGWSPSCFAPGNWPEPKFPSLHVLRELLLGLDRVLFGSAASPSDQVVVRKNSEGFPPLPPFLGNLRLKTDPLPD